VEAPTKDDISKQAQAAMSGDRTFDIGTIPSDIPTSPRKKRGDKPKKQGWWARRRAKKGKLPWSRRRKIITGIIVLIVLAVAAVGGYVGWKFLHNTGKIFQGNAIAALFSNKELKMDKYGRSNILLYGTSENDPGHPGAELTDSIMLVSIDQKKHQAFLMSVPRDLWVKYNKTCLNGYEGKINAYYLCARDEATNGGQSQDAAEQTAQAAFRSEVGQVFGMDIQYSVHANLEVLQKSIDALGGVDVDVQSTDPRGILDRNFDWRCHYACYLVKYPNGIHHLDGTQAMYLSQARNDANGFMQYGLPRGNFDREANQRKILIAAKSKASSVGFLANPGKVTQLLDALGSNVRTNITTSEVKTMVSVAKDTPGSAVASVSLIDQTPEILTTGSAPDGESIVRPVAGLYSYDALQAFTQAYLSGNQALLTEKAPVDVLNGTDTPGKAQTEADTLAGQGITIGKIGNTPAGATKSAGLKFYDLSAGKKPATKKQLEKVLGVQAATEPLPAGITSNASFVVIVGQ
jgi:polyisoprenyl-teichoic acid--peptidoglycan teichoic acid transferase